MLNELYVASKVIAKSGVSLKKTHPFIKPPGAFPTLCFGIGDNQTVVFDSYRAGEDVHKSWVLATDNQNRFPVFKLKAPIWSINKSGIELRKLIDGAGTPEQIYNVFKNLVGEGQIGYTSDTLNKLGKILSVFPKRILAIIERFPDKTAPLIYLIKRLFEFENDPNSFVTGITNALINEFIKKNDIRLLNLSEQLFFGKWDKKKKIFQDSEVQVMFDLSDYENFSFRVFSSEMASIMNELPLNELGTESGNSSAVCSLSGIFTESLIEKYPSPSLPLIGPTYLFSMNKDDRHHLRYRRISHEIYPVDKQVSNDLQDTILFLCSQNRKGKTWSSIPNGAKQDRDLLVAYLEKEPDIEANIADFFSECDGNDDQTAVYEETASEVIKALGGNDKNIFNSDLINVFAISKIDKGKSQISYQSSFTVEQIITGAKEWQKASKNAPPFSILLPGKKGEKADHREPGCPSPSAFLKGFQYQWIRKGTAKKKFGKKDENGVESSFIPGCSLSDVFDVFLSETQASSTARRLLILAFQRFFPLLAGVAEMIHQNKMLSLSTEARRSTLLGISIISILLYKIGHQKEIYMNEACFKIGRLFSLADTLHKQYCEHVRDGHIPSGLIGNSLIPAALDNPVDAICRLLERMRIYMAWAETAKGDNYKIAKWALKEMGAIAAMFAEADLPVKLDQVGKAKMLLGYISKS